MGVITAAVTKPRHIGLRLRLWAPQTSGNDIFYRNPYNVNENLFVDVSSPSSSNFSSVEDLGPPEAAAKRTLNQVGLFTHEPHSPDYSANQQRPTHVISVHHHCWAQ